MPEALKNHSQSENHKNHSSDRHAGGFAELEILNYIAPDLKIIYNETPKTFFYKSGPADHSGLYRFCSKTFVQLCFDGQRRHDQMQFQKTLHG